MRGILRTKAPEILPINMQDPSLILYAPLPYHYSDMDGATIYSYGEATRHAGLVGAVTGTTLNEFGRYFDGVDDKIDFPYSALLNPAQFTLIAWFNYIDLAVGQNKGLFTKIGYNVKICGVELALTPTGSLIINIGDNATPKGDEMPAAANTWYMGAGTYDEVNLTAWINGVPSGSPTATGITIDYTTDPRSWLIGNEFNDPQRYWHGYIGDCMVFNRALSEAELKNIYDATKWRYV